MSQARTAILYAPGTNCHEETAAAIELAGGNAELVLLKDLIGGETRLDDYHAAVVLLRRPFGRGKDFRHHARGPAARPIGALPGREETLAGNL